MNVICTGIVWGMGSFFVADKLVNEALLELLSRDFPRSLFLGFYDIEARVIYRLPQYSQQMLLS